MASLWGIIKGLLVQEENDRTKQLSVEVDSTATTSTRTTLKSAQTADRTLNLPDADDTLVGKATTDTLTNKTFDVDGTGNSLSNVRDAELAANADITRTKLAPGSNNHVLINDGSGEMSSEAQLAPSRGGTGQDLSSADGLLQYDSGVASAKAAKIDDTGSGGNITTFDLNASAPRTVTVPDADDTLVGRQTTDTLTNKTIGDDLLVQGTTDSTDKDTGAIVTEGGLGVEKSANIGGNLTVEGDLTVRGSQTILEVTTVASEDANISLNRNGNQAAANAQKSGITVEMSDATDAVLGYDSSKASKFVAGETGSEEEVITSGHQQVLTNKDIDGGVASDQNRIVLPSNTRTNLDGLTRKKGSLVYDDDIDKPLFDNGTDLIQIGTGEDVEDLEPEETFRAVIRDRMDLAPANADSKVDSSDTNANHDFARQIYELSCDKSKTFTTTGTALVISAAPTFTIAAGDIVYDNTSKEFRKIASITDQQNATLDAAFTTDLSSNAGMISQAVHTKDLINVGSATEKTRPRDFFSGDITRIFLEYRDTLIADDTVGDFVDEARLVAAVSNSGLVTDSGLPASTTFGDQVYIRPQAPAQILNHDLTSNTNQQRLHLVFFCNPDNASVTALANLLEYKCSFFQDETEALAPDAVEAAYAMSDGSKSPVNCSLSTVNGNTRVTLDWFYPVVQVEQADQPIKKISTAISVKVDGKDVPVEHSGVGDGELAFSQVATEGVSNILDFNTDLSVADVDIQIELRQGNTITRLDVGDQRNHIINGDFTIWQRRTSLSTSADSYVADRFGYFTSGTTMQITREIDHPTGGAYSLKHERTGGALGAPSASARNYVGYRMEGFDVVPLVGKKVAINFWAKSNKTGTFCVAIRNPQSNRSFVHEYTINVADTWEQKEILLTMEDTIWAQSNGADFELRWALYVGSTHQTGTTDDWVTGNFTATSNQTQIGEDSGDYLQLSKVQMVLGTFSPEFRTAGLNWAQELEMCERYYQKSYRYDDQPGGAQGLGSSMNFYHTDNRFFLDVDYRKRMRAQPTIAIFDNDGDSNAVTRYNDGSQDVVGVLNGTVAETSTGTVYLDRTGGATFAAGIAYFFQWTLDAEL